MVDWWCRPHPHRFRSGRFLEPTAWQLSQVFSSCYMSVVGGGLGGMAAVCTAWVQGLAARAQLDGARGCGLKHAKTPARTRTSLIMLQWNSPSTILNPSPILLVFQCAARLVDCGGILR